MGGTRGIGKAIAESLAASGHNVLATGRDIVDTSSMSSVRDFATAHTSTDILILNTGGPPAKDFEDVTEDEWRKYHNQLFLGFVTLLQNITVRDGGYIFLISSSVIREPSPRLVISAAYRAAFTEVFKIQSKALAERNISFVNIAPGLVDTDRARSLLTKMRFDPDSLPMKRMGRPQEVGDFVAAIVDRQIKYLSGVTIPFDGASSAYTF